MWNANNDTTTMDTQIFKVLREVNCCIRCCMKFSGISSFESYLKPLEYYKKLEVFINESESLNNGNGFTCISCLGALQDDNIAVFTEKVVSEIKKSGCDGVTYSLSLTVPLSVLIREKAVNVYLKQKIPALRSPPFLLSLKDIWKSLVSPKLQNEFSNFKECLQEDATLVIDIHTLFYADNKECLTVFQNSNSKNNMGRKKIEETLDSMLNFSELYLIPPPIPEFPISIDKVVCRQNNIFIGGRYVKLSRKLSQTPWFVNGIHKLETSVQDLIVNYLIDYTKCDGVKFLSSGREDVDVRMCLNGRPFAIELLNPKITKNLSLDLEDIKQKINSSTNNIQITSKLKVVTKADLITLKDGENSKSKTYRALCICKNVNNFAVHDLEKKVSNIKLLKIVQKTPVRVLHRRPLKYRERFIYKVRCRKPTRKEYSEYSKLTDLNFEKNPLLVFDINTEAGTYVKEFVHGDFGRTVPNLSEILGIEMDIVALDVMKINLDWP